MSDIDLKKLYDGMQMEMLQRLSTCANTITHPGTLGDNTEINWINWFQEYLPKRYRVNKGIVIDSTGKQSDQIDLIIYDAQYSYLVFHQNDTLLIPAESVYGVFEVKQTLNKANIEYAGSKAESVRKLLRTSAPIKHAGGKYPPKELHEILAGILTTQCKWKKPIADKVMKHVMNCDRQKRLDFVCSISDNTFVIENNTFVKELDSTKNPEAFYCEENESLVFLLLNLLRRLRDIGTVPAIDFSKYAEKIESSRYEMYDNAFICVTLKELLTIDKNITENVIIGFDGYNKKKNCYNKYLKFENLKTKSPEGIISDCLLCQRVLDFKITADGIMQIGIDYFE